MSLLTLKHCGFAKYFAAQTLLLITLVPWKGVLDVTLIFLVLLHRQEKMRLLQFIWRGIKQIFLHSPSLSWQGSLCPTFLGGTHVVAQEKGRFLDRGIMSSECKLLSWSSPGKSRSWALKWRVVVWADAAPWPGPDPCLQWRMSEQSDGIPVLWLDHFCSCTRHGQAPVPQFNAHHGVRPGSVSRVYF